MLLALSVPVSLSICLFVVVLFIVALSPFLIPAFAGADCENGAGQM